MEVETKGLKNFQDSSSAWGQCWSSCGGSTRMIEREETTFSWPLSLAQETPWDRPVDPFSKEQSLGRTSTQGVQEAPSTAPRTVPASQGTVLHCRQLVAPAGPAWCSAELRRHHRSRVWFLVDAEGFRWLVTSAACCRGVSKNQNCRKPSCSQGVTPHTPLMAIARVQGWTHDTGWPPQQRTLGCLLQDVQGCPAPLDVLLLTRLFPSPWRLHMPASPDKSSPGT